MYKRGFGLQYTLCPTVLVRVDAERYRINDAAAPAAEVTALR